MATGYMNAFITLAPDCPATAGTVPKQATSIAGLEHALLTERPYHYTGEEMILAVQRHHKGIGDADLDVFAATFFAKPHPCMRASMLPKRWGWGVHYDEQGRIALYGAETDKYCRLSARTDLRVMAAVRNRKGS